MANKVVSTSSPPKCDNLRILCGFLRVRRLWGAALSMVYVMLVVQNSLISAQSQLLNMLPFLEVMDFNLELKDMLLLNKLFNTQCQSIVNGQVNQFPSNNVLEVNANGGGGGLASAAAQPLTTSSGGQRTDFNGQASSSSSSSGGILFDPSSLASAFGFSDAAFGSNNGPFSFIMHSGSSNNNNNNHGVAEPSGYSPDAAAHDVSATVATFVHNFKKPAANEKSGGVDAWNPPLKKNFVFTDSKGRNLAEKLILSTTPAPTTVATKVNRPAQRFIKTLVVKQQQQSHTPAAKQQQQQHKQRKAATAVDAAEKEDFGPPTPTARPKAKAVSVSNNQNKNNNVNQQHNALRAMRLAARRVKGAPVRLVKFDRAT